MLVCFCISHSRHYMAHKASNIYRLALDKKRKKSACTEPETDGSLLQEQTSHSSDADRAPRTSAACSTNDMKAAFPPPHVWVVKFSETDNPSWGLHRQTHAGYLTRNSAHRSLCSSGSSLLLAAHWQSHPPPAPAGTTPKAKRRHQQRNASSMEAPPASS